MHRHSFLPLIVIFTILLTIGCAGGEVNPLTPDSLEGLEQSPVDMTDRAVQVPQTILWGYFDVWLDVESGRVETSVNRSAMFAANVVTFLNMNPAFLQFSFNGTSPGPGYVDVDLDVTINHPLNNPKFDGYDVRGIFIGDGTGSLAYNPELMVPVWGTEQILLNADGYTRWFNPSEFGTSGVLGYTQGNYASKTYTGTSTLNPYKYFGEGLGAADDLYGYLISGSADVGYFLNGTGNSRNYVIRFPIPLPGIKYGYAVVANWGGGAPQYHPSHAVEAQGINVVNDSNVYYIDETTNGGDIILDVSVFDWGSELSAGVMEDYGIIVESTVLSTPYSLNTSEMTPISSGVQDNTYHVEIPADNVTSTAGNEMWLIVEYPDADYTNPFGVPNVADTDPLAAFFRFDLPVSSEIPSWIQVLVPNGGESWAAGGSEEITWTSQDISGTVFIEYSTDDFVADINSIATGETDDGSYTWNPIPCIGSETTTVRVSSTDDPGVNDASDAYFSTDSGWVDAWGSATGDGRGLDVAAGDDGYIYVCGYEAVPGNGNDAYVRKYDQCGAMLWEIAWGDTDSDSINDIVLDGQGHFYVCGRFIGTVDFDPGSGVTNYSSFGGSMDVFISKFNVDGTFVWAKTWGDSGSDYAAGVGVDSLGNVYVTGSFEGTANFNPDGTDLHTSNGNADIFLSRFDASGAFQWARTWGGTQNDYGNDALVDSFDNGYVGGKFFGTVDFDPDLVDVDNRTSPGQFDAFVSKFDTSGDFLQVLTWGGANTTTVATMAIDALDNIFVAGELEGTADLDPDPVGVVPFISNGFSDAYVLMLDSSGTYQWAAAWGSTGYDDCRGIALDGQGYVYVGGIFEETVDFNPDPVGEDNLTWHGNYNDAFVSKFSVAGTYQWARGWGGPPIGTVTYGVAADEAGHAYVTGFYDDTVEFAPVDAPCNAPSDIHTGNADNFLVKYLPDGCW